MKSFKELFESKTGSYLKNELDNNHFYVVVDSKIDPKIKSDQDKYKMLIIKDGKTVKDLGSHPKSTGNPKYQKFKTVKEFD